MLIRRGLALLGTLALGGTLLGAAGCGGGLSTGDHAFYWVSIESAPPEASCYADNKIPDSIKDDITSVRGRSTFVLYITADGVAQLDTGAVVLAGTETDAGYSFKGETVDVEYPPGMKILDADKDGIDDTMDTAIDADKDGIDDQADPSVDTDMDGQDDRGQDPLVDADMDGRTTATRRSRAGSSSPRRRRSPSTSSSTAPPSLAPPRASRRSRATAGTARRTTPRRARARAPSPASRSSRPRSTSPTRRAPTHPERLQRAEGGSVA